MHEAWVEHEGHKLEAQWAQTSSLLALIANCHRDRKARSTPFEPHEFNPLAKHQPTGPVRKIKMADLTRIVCGGERPEHVLAEIAARDVQLKGEASPTPES